VHGYTNGETIKNKKYSTFAFACFIASKNALLMSLLQAFKQIRCFVFDVDGVLTDSTIWLLEDGQQVRRMNIKDGYALQLAIKKGYQMLVISGGNAPAVKERLNKLGVTNVFIGVENKLELLNRFLKENNFSTEQVLYMGDDIPDHECMLGCGLPCCPADAVPEIKHISRFVATHKGGEGCVREVIEKVLKLNQHWLMDTAIASK
jgi:3-deoxy-D-manno-octulosonate 8-phosphate phosphatase (KDO 8-P phosphatase)